MEKRCLALLIILAVALVAMDAGAVTYRNDGSGSVILKNMQGNPVILAPGNTLETYYFSDDANLTKTADTPYWNQWIDSDTVTATAEGANVSIDPATVYFTIFKITGTITVYIQSDQNSPAVLENWTSDDPIIQIPIKGRCNNIEIEGTGTCVVVQYLEQ
jgi:hypothetical protein